MLSNTHPGWYVASGEEGPRTPRAFQNRQGPKESPQNLYTQSKLKASLEFPQRSIGQVRGFGVFGMFGVLDLGLWAWGFRGVC